MSLTLAANTPQSFEIKSAQLPTVALRLKSSRLDEVTAELLQQGQDVPDFFDRDPLVIDFSALSTDDGTPEPTPPMMATRSPGFSSSRGTSSPSRAPG